jgi:acyl-CoA synthetase (AMP-forming)/AMP-acid ligase II
MHVPLTISDFLDRAALVFPDREAVVDEPGVAGDLGRISYRELDARANGMAAALDDLGVPVGGRVAIVSPNATRFLVAYFGVSGSGRVLVPINFRLNAAEVSYIVEHSGAEVLLVDPDSDAALADVTARERIVLDGAADAALFAPIAAGRRPRGWDPD